MPSTMAPAARLVAPSRLINDTAVQGATDSLYHRLTHVNHHVQHLRRPQVRPANGPVLSRQRDVGDRGAYALMKGQRRYSSGGILEVEPRGVEPAPSAMHWGGQRLYTAAGQLVAGKPIQVGTQRVHGFRGRGPLTCKPLSITCEAVHTYRVRGRQSSHGPGCDFHNHAAGR